MTINDKTLENLSKLSKIKIDDNLRDKFTNEGNEQNLKFLDHLNNYVMSIEKKYKNI